MMNRIEWKNIRFVPIIHNRMEFALEVRRQFLEFRPDHVAVEYPVTLKDKILKAVERLPLLSVVHYEEDDETLVYLPIEPTDGQVEAIRLALENDIPVHFIDRDCDEYPADDSPMPDPYSITRIGYMEFCGAYFEQQSDIKRDQIDILREKSMAYSLQNLSRKGGRIFYTGGMYHVPAILGMLDQPLTDVIGRRKRNGVGISHLHEESSREILTEMPFLTAAYEQFRGKKDSPVPDRLKINNELIQSAREAYWKNDKEELSQNHIDIMNRFARNYAVITGSLVADFYQLVIAARGVADDNFAWEVWDKGSHYPWQEENPDLPVLYLDGDDLFLNHRRIRFHKRIKTSRRRLVPMPVKRRKRENKEGEWKEDFKGNYICSYPPEDIVIEGYGRHLMRRAIEIKSEENSSIVPFISSMMDGLDIRSSIRDYTSGKLYVKENRPVRGKVGSIVVIFDQDIPDKRGKENFPWRVTWLGEHDQESDMSFYGTPAGEVMDGPGISRCQYGGFMLTYPPMRVYDIWRDSFFNTARNKPERLLMAAIDYCLEKHVVYVAGTGPSGWCRSMAASRGKNIIYLPIGVFSPVTLKRMRQFHVLEGHHIRKYAHEYI